jgi:hypothetical protein
MTIWLDYDIDWLVVFQQLARKLELFGDLRVQSFHPFLSSFIG